MCSLTDFFFQKATPLRTVDMPNWNSWTCLPFSFHARVTMICSPQFIMALTSVIIKNKMLLSAMWKKQHLVNKQGLWGKQLCCKSWATDKGQQDNHCPHCEGSLGKSKKSKWGDLHLTRWLVSLHECLKMHTDMETEEENVSKEQTVRIVKKNEKKKRTRLKKYIIGRNTSDKDNVVMKAED